MSIETLFGRNAELARLRGFLTGVTEGRGAALRIEGEPGVGKTALLRAAIAEAERRGCAVRHLRELHERLRGDQPDSAHLDATVAVVENLCATVPLVIAVDDAHRADEASLLVWVRLSHLTERLPLLLVAVGTDPIAAGEVRIPLSPLDAVATAELAAHLTGAEEVGHALRSMLRLAGGNPRYVREMVPALRREHRLRVLSSRAELTSSAHNALPVALTEAVVGRMGFVGSDTIGLLRAAALLEPTFAATDLRTVSGLPVVSLVGCVEEALTAGLLVESGARLRFQHGLIRQVLHETTPLPVRLALHRHAARRLAASGAPVEQVGEHLRSSIATTEACLDDWALDWLAEHGCELADRAPHCADPLLGEAIRLSEAGPRREHLRTAQVLANMRLGRSDAAPCRVPVVAERSAAPSGPAGKATRGWAALTPTERRIARLVADGMANPDIASALACSRRTVEVHVSHILTKLGVRSRVEVAVEATRHEAAQSGS